MCIYEVLKRVNLTVEIGSMVTLLPAQLKMVQGYVRPVPYEQTLEGMADELVRLMDQVSTLVDENSLLAEKIKEYEAKEAAAKEAVSDATVKNKALNKMTKAELLAVAAEKGMEIPGDITNAEIVKLIEKQV